MEKFRSPVLIIVCGVIFFSLQLPTGHAADARKDLDAIKEKITREQRNLSQLKTQEGSLVNALAQVQRDLALRNRELQNANSQLAVLNKKLALTEGESKQLAASMEGRTRMLAKRAVALYRWQRGGSPMIIFSGKFDLSEILRRRTYLQAALAFDQQLVQSLAQETKQNNQLRRELEENRQAIAAKQAEVAATKRAVQAEVAKKNTLLASIRKEKSVRSKALAEMEQAALRLQKILDELARRPPTPRALEKGSPATASLPGSRGQLEWPVRGPILQGFGKSKHPVFAAEVFRNGIDIEAVMGEPIKAVEKGRVVFANRLAGYGNMIVVDHGQRFFTIYGHLSELAKQNGEPVQKGEVVGRVGDSDSIQGAKLYFEIRRDGRPVDPLPWLRK